MSQYEPFFQQVQAHYDLSDHFYALFLDPSLTYSCAYFQRDEMSLAEAQTAKIDLVLGKCDLRTGMRLLDIGCGWGSAARRAIERFGVRMVALTLSQNQCRHVSALAARLGGPDILDVRLQGWEQFDQPVDRIMSIGAFEHFRRARYPSFFARCRAVLPASGRMLLHTIVAPHTRDLHAAGIPVTHENVLFAKFIQKHIFPGGQLCPPQTIIAEAQRAGFCIAQTQSLRLHYARTLDCWAANLGKAEQQAVALTSTQVFDRYMHYLTGCADHFRSGHIDVIQFTLCPVQRSDS
jgi:cyclopropane-fatty-acyl-phospholipid synthase